VTNDPSEVCPLSRRVMLLMAQPVSASLQSGVRLLRHPVPAPRVARLATSLPCSAARTLMG